MNKFPAMRLHLAVSETERQMQIASDVLGLSPEKLGMAFSDREIAKTYVAQAQRALVALLAFLPQQDNEEEG